MAFGLPDGASFCVELSTGPGELCVTLPGAATLCATFGFETGDPAKIVSSMLGTVNAALTPLAPFFAVLDALKAIVDCVQAVPDAITQLDVTGLLACVPEMVKKLQKVLALIPQLSVPMMIISILDVIIVGMMGLRAQMAAMIRQLDKITAAAARAAELGNVDLQVIVDCSMANLEAHAENMNASMAPLNRLLGLINLMLELAGLPCIPSVALGTEVGQAGLDAIDVIIDVLQTAKAAIPGPDFQLPAIPGPDDPC